MFLHFENYSLNISSVIQKIHPQQYPALIILANAQLVTTGINLKSQNMKGQNKF